MDQKLKADAQYWIEMGARVFPIAIERHGDKWHKRPLTPHGHKDATDNLNAFEWATANGFGITMGAGLYALDVDTYKTAAAAKQWMHQNAVPLDTRAHTTVSGGAHLIYRTGGEYLDLRSRQGVVRGLDTRGAGGWIAWGAGYGIQNARDPVHLPLRVCKALHAGADAQNVAVMLQALEPVEQPALADKLRKALKMSPAFARRWRGENSGIEAGLRSSLDLSTAQLLGLLGFTYSEIFNALMHHYRFGQAKGRGRMLTPKAVERAAHRCAARAIAARDERERTMRAMLNQKGTLTDAQQEAMRAAIAGAGK